MHGPREVLSADDVRRALTRIAHEVVERNHGYDGYGAPNAPVRLASQHSSPKMIMRGTR